MTAVFTVASRHHLHRARALMKSVETHLPGAKRFLFLTDSPDGLFYPEKERFSIIPGAELGVQNYRRLAFALDGISLCCALKPIGAAHLLREHGAKRLIYLDADTLLLASPESLLAHLENHPIILSPHLLYAAANQRMSLMTMRSGAFNGGLFAVNHSESARQFVDWWGENSLLSGNLRDDWSHDQGWLNHTPTLFPACFIHRDPGYNVAFWNLHEREISVDAAGYRANRERLTMFHFSHFDRRLPYSLTGSLTTAFPPPNDTVRSLLHQYAAELNSAQAGVCEQWKYGFGTFSDGKPIRPVHRRYFQDRVAGTLPPGADPFDAKLSVPTLNGLKSLYRSDHPATRWIRGLRSAIRQF